MNINRVFAVAFTLTISACSGGTPSNEVIQFKVGQSLKKVSLDSCVGTPHLGETPSQLVSDGRHCVQSFMPIRMKSMSSRRVQRFSSVAQSALTFEKLLSWAELTFPNFFYGSFIDDVFEGFVYRHYPAVDNYIAQKDGNIYVIGTITNWDLLFVGSLEDLQCTVLPKCGGATEIEPNDSFSSAQSITAGTTYSGSLSENDTSMDFYKLSVGASGPLSININVPKILDSVGLPFSFPMVEISIYDSADRLVQSDYLFDGESSFSIKNASIGTYSVRIQTPFPLGLLSYPEEIRYELSYSGAGTAAQPPSNPTANTTNSTGTSSSPPANTPTGTSGSASSSSCAIVPMGTSLAPNQAPYNQPGTSEVETTDSPSNATVLKEGVWVNASLSSSSDIDYYVIERLSNLLDDDIIFEIKLPNITDQDASYIQLGQSGAARGWENMDVSNSLAGGLNIWRNSNIGGPYIRLSDSTASIEPKSYQIRFYRDPNSKRNASEPYLYSGGDGGTMNAAPLPNNRILKNTIVSKGLSSTGTVINISAVNSDHYIIQLSDGTYWSGGKNLSGQVLPEACGGTVGLPVQLDLDPKLYTQVVATDQVTFAFGPNVDPIGWGNNSNGILGDGTRTPNSGITTIKNTGPIQAIATNGKQSSAVGVDGTLWIWGDGYYDKSLSHIPQKVGTGYKSVVSANGAFFALSTDGTVYVLGLRDTPIHGELGRAPKDGDNVRLPYKILTDVKQVAATIDTGYAIKTDGTLWTWGWNAYGQLGEGEPWPDRTSIDSKELYRPNLPYQYRETPKQVGSGYREIFTGWNQVLAITTDSRGVSKNWGWGQSSSAMNITGVGIEVNSHPYQIDELTQTTLAKAVVSRRFSMHQSVKGALSTYSRNGDFGRLFKSGASSPTEGPLYLPITFPSDSTLSNQAGSVETSTGGSSNTGSEEANAQAAQACKIESEADGFSGDYQFDVFCRLAAFDACMHRALNTTAFDIEGDYSCKILKEMVDMTWGGKMQCNVCTSGYPFPPR
jgi:hypothetical protein